MILWLASYPKSGNTWVRSFIVSLLYSKEGKANLKDISKIKQYPLRLHFKTLTSNIDDLQQLYKNWIPSQKLINLDNKIKFLKTHHIMCNFGKYSFTNYENTFGVIYIVRDPRNIVTSLMNHYSFLNYTEAKNFLLNENQTIGRNLNEKIIKISKKKKLLH